MRPQRLTTVMVALALGFAATATAQQTADELYQAGLYQEEVQGNLQNAITIYQRILSEHASSRAVAAKAQLHVGICYETLGLQEAQQAYQRVVANYGDQSDVVRQARARLAALRAVATAAAPTGPVARRLLEDDGCNAWAMRPSPDGTRVAYTDACGLLAVFVRDLASGHVEQITTEGMHVGNAWSSDGRRLATAEVFPRQQLKIIDLETGAIQEPSGVEGPLFIPDDWSSDGEHLAGMVTDTDMSRSTAALSLNTGNRITLAAQVPASSARTAFSPDGRHVAFVDFTEGNQDIYVLTLETGERHRITTGPEVDRDAVWSPDGSTILYRNPLGTWAISMVDGRVDGEPRLVRGEPNSATWNWNTSWTASGYYYVSQQSVIRPYRIAIDPETKQAVGEPELIDEPMPDLSYNARFSWSPDMERIASTTGGDQGRIHVSSGQALTSFQIGDGMRVSDLWWSEDGAEILYNTRAGDQQDVRKTVFSLNPEDGRVRELFPATELGHHIHVSPDGARMVFLRPSQIHPDSGLTLAGEMVVSDLGDFTGGRVLAQSSDPAGELSTFYGQPRFSPDGSQVLFFRVPWSDLLNEDARMSLWVIPADGSAPARRLAEAPRIDPPYWDPSGRWIALQEYRGSDQSTARGMISIVSVETGRKHEILAWGGEGMTAGSLILRTQLKAWSPDGRWIGITQGTGSHEYWVVDDPLGERAGQGR